MLKYSIIILATISIFSGCGSDACCDGDKKDPIILGNPEPKIPEPLVPSPLIPEPLAPNPSIPEPVNPIPVTPELEPKPKIPTAVITLGDCDVNARYFNCLDSKDNDDINPIPDIGIPETSIVRCDWTIKVFNFDDTPTMSAQYSTFIIFDVNGEVDLASTTEADRWIGHDENYKIIELNVTDDDGQVSETTIKKFNYDLGECGELENP